jgi:hypothetical protein
VQQVLQVKLEQQELLALLVKLVIRVILVPLARWDPLDLKVILEERRVLLVILVQLALLVLLVLLAQLVLLVQQVPQVLLA